MPAFTNYSGEIANQLDRYRTKGQKEAGAHRPPTDSAHMDQNEVALKVDAEKWFANEQRIFDSVMTEASRAAVDTRQKSIELQSKVNQLLSDGLLLVTVEADMAEERGKLVSATEKRMRAEVDWRAHRAKNNISAQAVYPESLIWHLSIIAVLALIETCINAFFYENAQGLLGGFTVALGVAFVNMVSALLFGYGFRCKNLKAIDSRILGWSCLVAFAVLTVYCNALFAAFRAEYQLLSDPTDALQVREGFALAAAEAKKAFLLDMRIADMSSFVLFGFGIVLSCFAFYKGYTLDDKYPGHGKLDRTVKAAKSLEVEQQNLLRQRIKDYLHHRRAEVQAAMHEPSQLISLAARRISELESAKALLTSQAQAIQRDFSMVLGAYRTANTAVRATDPPAYFKEIPDLTTMVNGSGSEQYIQQLGELQSELKHFREEQQEPLNKKLQELQGDAASILNHTFSAFVKDIEAEAQENINRTVATIYRDHLESTNA